MTGGMLPAMSGRTITNGVRLSILDRNLCNLCQPFWFSTGQDCGHEWIQELTVATVRSRKALSDNFGASFGVMTLLKVSFGVTITSFLRCCEAINKESDAIV